MQSEKTDMLRYLKIEEDIQLAPHLACFYALKANKNAQKIKSPNIKTSSA